MLNCIRWPRLAVHRQSSQGEVMSLGSSRGFITFTAAEQHLPRLTLHSQKRWVALLGLSRLYGWRHSLCSSYPPAGSSSSSSRDFRSVSFERPVELIWFLSVMYQGNVKLPNVGKLLSIFPSELWVLKCETGLLAGGLSHSVIFRILFLFLFYFYRHVFFFPSPPSLSVFEDTLHLHSAFLL